LFITGSPNSSKNFKAFYAKKPVVIHIVIGRNVAQTPSLFIYPSVTLLLQED